MQIELQKKGSGFFARQPLSGFGRYVVGVLLWGAVMLTGIKLGVGHGGGPPLVDTVTLFLGALAMVTGLLWAPFLATIALIVMLYGMYEQPFVLDHLQHPKEVFPLFVVVLMLYALFLSGLLASVVALVQNYKSGERTTPRWFSMLLSSVGGVVVGGIIIGLLAQSGPSTATTTTTYTNGVPTVHMAVGSFEQSSVTISKGSKLFLADDGNYHHELNMGSWVNGQPQTENLPSEPSVSGLSVTGNNVTIGPFPIAGTYHLYCSIHTGMMLTIIVQ